MKLHSLLLVLACSCVILCSSSCSLFGPKTGCPSNGKNVGAERINESLDGGTKVPKARKFRS